VRPIEFHNSQSNCHNRGTMTNRGSNSMTPESIGILNEDIQDRKFTLEALRSVGVRDKQLLYAGVLFEHKQPRVDTDGYLVCSQPVEEILDALDDGTLCDVIRQKKYKLSQFYASDATNKNLCNVGVRFDKSNVLVDDNQCPQYSEPVEEITTHLVQGTLVAVLKNKYLLSEYYASGVTDDDLITAGVTYENRKGVMHIKTDRKIPVVGAQRIARVERQPGEYDETEKRKKERKKAFVQSRQVKKARDLEKKRKATEQRKIEEKETAYRDGPMQKGATWSKSDRDYLHAKMKAAKDFRFNNYDGDPVDIMNSRETRPAELRACQRALDSHQNPTQQTQTTRKRTYKVIVRDICRLATRMVAKEENIIPDQYDEYRELLAPINAYMNKWDFHIEGTVGGTGWVDAMHRFRLSERQVSTLDGIFLYVKTDVEHFDLELEVNALDLVKEDHLTKHSYNVSEKVKFVKEYSDVVGRIKERLRAYDLVQGSPRAEIAQHLQGINNAIRRFLDDAYTFFKQEVRRLKQGKPRKRKAPRPGTVRQQDITANEQGRIGTVHTELPRTFKEPGRSVSKRRKVDGQTATISLDMYQAASRAEGLRTFTAGPVGQGGILFSAGAISHTRQTAFPDPVPSPVTTENGSCYSSDSDDGLDLRHFEDDFTTAGFTTMTSEEMAIIGDVWKSN